MQLSVRGYETQVKVFLILVVLFLVTANLVTITFLIRSESLLQDEAVARVLAATEAMAREADARAMAAPLIEDVPGAAAEAADKLSRLQSGSGAYVTEIVDGEGRVVASSQSWRRGDRQGLDARMDAASLAALRSGGPVVIPGDEPGDPISAYVPLKKSGTGGPLYLRASFASAAMETISNRIELLTWAQGIGGSIVLLMVLFFTRFVLRPYRELRAAAAGLEAAGREPQSADDPAFLVASFRGVVEKMRSLEGELERMKRAPSAAGSEESFISGLSSGVLIVDEKGCIAALNPAGESVLGKTASEAAGLDAREVFAASPEFAGLLDDAVTHGRGHTREMVPYRLETGRIVHLGVTVSSPPGAAGGALCLFSDLTEIRSLQARVLLKENLARVGELSAGIAHEFRNGLATILGYARLQTRQAGAGEENAQAIIREVQGMERMVSEFLRYAGPARIEKGACDLKRLMEEIAREVKREEEPPVTIALRGEWPRSLLADEGLLRQAFHNLLRNAVEAALEGGEPRVVRVTAQVGETGVSVEVADSGPGFPAEVLEKLFTPFVSTKSKGTGLGMAMAQKVMISHDGGLEAGNAQEGGGRVTATLPLA